MINELILKEEKYRGYEIIDSPNRLKNLNKINVFIGQNNSGKSRFLRTLFADNEFEFQLFKVDLDTIKSYLKIQQSKIKSLFNDAGFAELDDILKSITSLEGDITNFRIGEVGQLVRRLHSFTNSLISKERISGASHLPHIQYNNTDPNSLLIYIKQISLNTKEKIDKVFPENFEYHIHRVYIPILRGLRPIQLNRENTIANETRDNYKVRTVKDYFQEKEKAVENEIFTGLNLYTDTKKQLLGNREKRESIKKFETFLGTTFFEGKEVTLTPHIDNDVLQITIDGDDKFIYELGDGIQALIVLLYPLFFNQNKNLLVFIEEPENSMHPGLQRLFIETLMREEFKNFQFFFTTHSNHFLDITLDFSNISIYTFHKTVEEGSNDAIFKIGSTSHQDIKILDLIGARTSSVFLSNCTIWVEGITDRFYLKKYLEIYQNYLFAKGTLKSVYKEDFHFSFVEYAGGNIVHWSFINEEAFEKINATKISSKIFLIADRDSTREKATSAKAKRLQQLKEKLGNNFLIVDGREIENTLNGNVLIKAIKKLEEENFDTVAYNDHKIKYEKYQDLRIGTFIRNSFINTKRKYAADSGTIFCKLEFCKAAVVSMNDMDDLSSAGKTIAEKLFKFIDSSNQF